VPETPATGRPAGAGMIAVVDPIRSGYWQTGAWWSLGKGAPDGGEQDPADDGHLLSELTPSRRPVPCSTVVDCRGARCRLTHPQPATARRLSQGVTPGRTNYREYVGSAPTNTRGPRWARTASFIARLFSNSYNNRLYNFLPEITILARLLLINSQPTEATRHTVRNESEPIDQETRQ